MKQESTFRPERTIPGAQTIGGYGKRLVGPAIFFAIAFVIDMLTNQRYSSIWGSAAIVASVIHLFPAIRPALAAIGAYAGTWVGFNLIRAVADDAGLAIGGLNAIADTERSLFGGTLPSLTAQDAFFDPDAIGMHDVVLSAVHGSFFVVPFVVAGFLLWKHRRLLGPYTVATGIMFALGLVGFLLLPTSPPWLADADITRVTHSVLPESLNVSGDGGDGIAGGFSFEPNHYAAMPSVHVGATVLVFLMLRQFGRTATILGAIYAFLMTIGVIYLGEHYVVDALGGWAIAIAAWVAMHRWLPDEAHRRSS